MKVTLVKERKQKPDFSKLGFGKYFTDHMLVMEYDEAKGGWDEPEIIPFDDLIILYCLFKLIQVALRDR